MESCQPIKRLKDKKKTVSLSHLPHHISKTVKHQAQNSHYKTSTHVTQQVWHVTVLSVTDDQQCSASKTINSAQRHGRSTVLSVKYDQQCSASRTINSAQRQRRSTVLSVKDDQQCSASRTINSAQRHGRSVGQPQHDLSLLLCSI
jgi:hypothetical protein